MPTLTSNKKPAEEQPLIEKTLFWAKQIQEWRVPWVSGIYPGEMAAFLALCDSCDVRSIVESGRGEGDSTQILGEYARMKGIRVISIDWEKLDMAARCRERLNGYYREILFIKGDALEEIPHALEASAAPIALLLDGPKLHLANRISLVSAILYPVAVVAHHNCSLETSWGSEFARMFPGAYHYESSELDPLSEWRSFKEWEREWVRHTEVSPENWREGRSLTLSSLALAKISKRERSSLRLIRFQSWSRASNLLWLWLKWSIRERPRVAELDSVHDGSFGNAKRLIDAAAECDADAAEVPDAHRAGGNGQEGKTMSGLIDSIRCALGTMQFLLGKSTGVATRNCVFCSSEKIRLYPREKLQLAYSIPACAKNFEDQMFRRDNGICLECGLEQSFYRFSDEGGKIFSDLGLDVLSVDNEFGKYPPSTEWMQRVYENESAKRIPKWDAYLASHSIERLARVLHVRCHYGDALRHFQQKYGAETWGVGTIHNCSRYIRGNIPSIHLLKGELTSSLEFDERTAGKFDLIICSHTLVHSMNVVKDLNSLRSLLSENGRVIFAEEVSRKLHNPFHLNHHSEKVFLKMLSRFFNRIDRIDDCGMRDPFVIPHTVKGDNPDFIAWNEPA